MANEKLTAVEHSRRASAAQTLHGAATIVSVYRKDETELVAKLEALAEDIMENGHG